MKQPIKNNGETKPKKVKRRSSYNYKKKHPKYGTSKLEDYFAKNFLDKLGVKYTYQFEAKDIGRFFDFLVNDDLIIEVDGSYYHAYGLKYEEMSPMQKKNVRVDEMKTKWALLHGFPIVRVWEHDIRKNPKKVMDMLKERLYLDKKQKLIAENKKKRNFNKKIEENKKE